MSGFILLSLMLPLTAPPTIASEPAKPEKIICRTSRELGSNFSRRTCKTKAQWDYDKRMAREYLDTNRPIPVPNPTRGN